MVRFAQPSEQRVPQSLIVTAWMIVIIVIVASAPSRAAERTIAIARSDCELAVRYVTPPGVDYQPGVDVNGRPVAPADLDDGRRLQLPESIPVFITDNLRRRFHVPHHSALYDTDAVAGIVELRLSDNRLTIGVVEIGSAEADALAATCRDALKSP